MNRRNFFRSMIGGVAAAAAVRMFPFRVFSFPSEIVVPPISRTDMLYGFGQLYPDNMMSAECLEVLKRELVLTNNFNKAFPIGSVVRIRVPQHFAKNFYLPHERKELFT